MQIDGEPWLQPGGVIELRAGGQVTLLEAETTISDTTDDED